MLVIFQEEGLCDLHACRGMHVGYIFECSFYQIQVQVIANLPSRLEKHQTLDIVLMTDFFVNF